MPPPPPGISVSLVGHPIASPRHQRGCRSAPCSISVWSRTGSDHPLSPWTKFMVGAGGQAQGGTTTLDEHGAERQPAPSPGEGVPRWAASPADGVGGRACRCMIASTSFFRAGCRAAGPGCRPTRAPPPGSAALGAPDRQQLQVGRVHGEQGHVRERADHAGGSFALQRRQFADHAADRVVAERERLARMPTP